jgi:beta-glucosidase
MESRVACPVMNGAAFPTGFVWGTATAAHQVEGGNWNNDWWAWEHRPDTNCADPSGDACDHYHRYREDIALLAALGFGSYRFSVEWSRIEPEPGEFSRQALDHYRRMVACCREHGLDAVVTLHHFTSPRWLAAEGGFAETKTIERFVRFAEQVGSHLGDLVNRWCTFNEPNIVSTYGYLAGVFPPGLADRDARQRANDVFIEAHRRAMPVLKAASDAPAGFTLSMRETIAVGDTDDERAAAQRRLEHVQIGFEDVFLAAAAGDDYFGVQTYSRERFGPTGNAGPEPGHRTTLMGYEFRPQALAATIRRAWEHTDHTPILVTENGIATEDDTERIEYVDGALRGVLGCLADGVEVIGYTYWSLLDNFEWLLGYRPTFGLVEVDRATQLRTVKPSGHWLGRVARANALP